METMLEANTETWGDDVAGLFIARDNDEPGDIERCSEAHSFPVVHDDVDGNLWRVLGGYDYIAIVDRDGTLAYHFEHPDIYGRDGELGEDYDAIVAAVNELLGL